METLAQVIQSILANIQVLGLFNNMSNVSIWQQIVNVMGLIVYTTRVEIANSESTITNILIGQQGLGKTDYYTSAALQYQTGQNVVINTAINPVTGMPYLNYIYNPVDTSLQIINQAAFGTTTTGNNILLYLKIATITSGVLGPLSNAQLTAFSSYYKLFELPGLPINIVNSPANILNFNSVATYLSSFDLTILTAAVATYFTSFENSFQFNGVFFAGDLEDYIKQNVPGMRDFFISNTTIDNIPFQGSTTLSSGYFNYISSILTQIVYTPIN